ncbi:MAG TPA: BON domain-containing protein [Polyangiaceae bacterium]|nr:BON domain-containing protein [Polyangiaceae bacterium]
MSFRLAALLCLTGAVAACSHNTEASNTADAYPTPVAQAEPVNRPVATMGSTEVIDSGAPHTSGTPTPSTTDARAPLLADTKGPSSNAAKAEPARENSPTPSNGAVQPDNTKVNERDRSSSALTPLDQRENDTDLKITQHVRQAVMADSSLSFTAKNVKIITQAGKVTLRGPVKTAQERDAIDAAARKVAGVTQVDNQIEVKK